MSNETMVSSEEMNTAYDLAMTSRRAREVRRQTVALLC
jgi:hypothetical protein